MLKSRYLEKIQKKKAKNKTALTVLSLSENIEDESKMTSENKILQLFLENNNFKATPQAPEIDQNIMRDLGTLEQKTQSNEGNSNIYIVRYSNGTKFTGKIDERKETENYNQPLDKGRFEFPNGDTYEGQIAKRGNGKYTHRNGTIYEGQFFQLKRSGQGEEIFPDKSVYKGMFRKNIKNGKGTMKFAEGDLYEGNFQNGKRNGLGVYTFTSGELVSGDWLNDELEGKGRWKRLTGEVLKGSFIKSRVVF